LANRCPNCTHTHMTEDCNENVNDNKYYSSSQHSIGVEFVQGVIP